jgi:hypothetical protein
MALEAQDRRMTFLPSLLNADLARERTRGGRRPAPGVRVVRPVRSSPTASRSS